MLHPVETNRYQPPPINGFSEQNTHETTTHGEITNKLSFTFNKLKKHPTKRTK